MDEILSAGVAFLASLVLTPLVIRAARRWGKVAQPRRDRWHNRPTALLGGVAIFGAFLAGALPWMDLSNATVRQRVLGVLVGSTLVFLLGLIDDLVNIKPGSKLIGQIVAACVLVYVGVYFDILGMPLVTIPLTVFFVVSITNAFNLLDNMDGLASGVAAICALTIFAFNVWLGTAQAIGVLSLALAGSVLGFLVFNFNPARIFMGDSGSLFLGFTIAAISILGTWEQASNTFLILAVPVLLLGLPIFDTTLVTVLRTLSGRPVSVGGRDHTSHRLVRLGLSERRSVLVLYAVCVGFSIIAMLSLKLGLFATGVLSILALITLFVFGVFLAHERIYESVEGGAARPSGNNGRPAGQHGALIETFVMHKMRIAEVLIDLLLFAAAYVAANLIRFEGAIPAPVQERMVYALPVLLAIKFVCFYGFGLYRQIWQFTGIHEMIVIVKAVFTASLVSVAVLWALTRLAGYSRAVFVVDGLLLLVFAAGSRMLFRVFRESFMTTHPGARRLMIYGAGAAGELLLREIRSNPRLGYEPVGFLDDDGSKRGRRIHGLKIFGGRERLDQILREATIDEVVIAIPSLDPGARDRLRHRCVQAGVTCRQMKGVSTTFLG